ncbi:MAG: hypothetical protein CM15mP109_13010 [Candidatus Dadabacteria bacterium]|nr:MAG: hypothetical protein CM15mP109_13010 [Candidatus Dadabacteria bacterium]
MNKFYIKNLYFFNDIFYVHFNELCFCKITLSTTLILFAWEKDSPFYFKIKYVYFINETDNFFKENNCENDNRNLKYIRLVGDEIKKIYHIRKI